MALKGRITKTEFDTLHEVIRKEYKAFLKDGVQQKDAQGNELYILDAPDMEHRDDISGLRTALENERQTATQRQQKIAEHEAAITRLNGELENARKGHKPDVESAIEAAKKELIEKHNADLEKANKQSEGYRAALDKAVRIDAARAAIAKAKGSPDLLLPHVLDRTQFVEDKDANGNPTGTFSVIVVNEKGVQRIGDSQANPMTLDQLVTEMKSNEVYARAFEAEGKGGSGAPPNGGGGGAGTVSKKSDLKSSADKAKFIRDNGHEKYVELPD